MVLEISVSLVKAFDPVSPHTPLSIETTTQRLVDLVIPVIDYPNGSVQDVLDFIEQKGDIPKEHRIHVSLKGFQTLNRTKVKLVEKNITKLDALANIAEQIKIDLLIQPGKVVLLKRNATNEQVTTPSP